MSSSCSYCSNLSLPDQSFCGRLVCSVQAGLDLRVHETPTFPTESNTTPSATTADDATSATVVEDRIRMTVEEFLSLTEDDLKSMDSSSS